MKKHINIFLLFIIVVLGVYLSVVKAERDQFQQRSALDYQRTTHEIMTLTDSSLIDLDATQRSMTGSRLYATTQKLYDFSGDRGLVADRLKNISEALLIDKYKPDMEPIREDIHSLFNSINELLEDNSRSWYESFTNRDSEVHSLLKKYNEIN